jgi:hypothetical protein
MPFACIDFEKKYVQIQPMSFVMHTCSNNMEDLIYCIKLQELYHKNNPTNNYINESILENVTARYQMVESVITISNNYLQLIEQCQKTTAHEKKIQTKELRDFIPFAIYIMDRFLSRFNTNVSKILPEDAYFISISSLVLASKIMSDDEISYQDMMYICAPQLQGPFTNYKNYILFDYKICSFLDFNFNFVITPQYLIEKFFDAFKCSNTVIPIKSIEYCNKVFYSHDMIGVNTVSVALQSVYYACIHLNCDQEYAQKLHDFIKKIQQEPEQQEMYYKVLPKNSKRKNQMSDYDEKQDENVEIKKNIKRTRSNILTDQ